MKRHPLWHLPQSRCHSYIRLWRVLLLRSGIRLSPSDIRYAKIPALSALKVNFQISEWGMRTLAPIRREGSCRSLSAGTKKGTHLGAFVLAEREGFEPSERY